jgi:hypothetical protein
MGGGASKGNQTPRRLSLTKPPPQKNPQYPQHPQYPPHQYSARQHPGYDSRTPSPPMKRWLIIWKLAYKIDSGLKNYRHIQPSPSTHTLKSHRGNDNSPHVSNKGRQQTHKLNNNDYGDTDSDDDSRSSTPVYRGKRGHKRSVSAGSYR